VSLFVLSPEIEDRDKVEVATGRFFKFHLIVGVEESIVNALCRLRITDQLFKSYVLQE
jgi:hypothetical protein